MSISVRQLKKYKETLRRFSSLETSEIYNILSIIYKAQIQPQDLVDSEITKSISRISQKDPHEFSDDTRRQKCVKLSKKLLKLWKQVLGYDNQNNTEPIKKQVRNEIKIVNNSQDNDDHEVPIKKQLKTEHPVEIIKAKQEINNKQTPTPQKSEVNQETRDKAIAGLIKYLKKYMEENETNLARQLESEIYRQNKENIEDYKSQTKSAVKTIDKDEKYRKMFIEGIISIDNFLNLKIN